MKTKNFLKFSTLGLALALIWTTPSKAQTSKKLAVGDMAPELKYSQWIKGEPLKSLEGDKLYVLEFWATWCSPCKAAMPHLTQLQKQYKDKATIIGVGVWERVEAGKPYESSLPYVTKFVKGNESNMGYSVIADNNEQYMGNQWLKAAGENGIPSTFIVKNKKILWIGHPNSLDSIIPKIIDGSFNMVAFKSAREKRVESSNKENEAIMAIFKPIQTALLAKDYASALTLIDKAAIDHPQYKPMFSGMKFGALLNSGKIEEAKVFAKEWESVHKGAPSSILGEVYNKDGLPKEVYLWAANNFVEAKLGTNPVILDALATCYAKAGDFKNAVINQEKALSDAKTALKDGTMVGTIMDYTVTDYEAKLNKYKSQVKQ